MRSADSRGEKRHLGLVPVVLAVLGVLVDVLWLMRYDANTRIATGYIAAPMAMIAASWSCNRIGKQVVVPRPVRAFWRRFSHASFCVGIGSAAALVIGKNTAGISPWVAVPMLFGIGFALLAFANLGLGERSMLRWAQLALDGLTVAVGGALIFWYVVLDYAPSGTPIGSQIFAAGTGVAALLCVVVIGKASASPSCPIDPLALRILALAPATAIPTVVFLMSGSASARLAVNIMTIPIVALAISLGAYRQALVVNRPANEPASASARRSIIDLLPFLAVAATAGLVISVASRSLDWHQRSVIVGAVLIAAFVVLRQLLGLRENHRLLRGLHRQQAELEYLALHDPLTGLANRTLFGAKLTDRLNAHLPAAVLLIDIDDFKIINETMGHALGDQLLYEVAQRLQAHSTVTDLPARLGGDEFAVLLDFDTPADAEEAAARILAAITVPFRVDEHQLLVHASVGVALAAGGDTADEVLRNADIAMYAAKDQGKASYARFEPRMRNEVVNHARLGSELHNAIIRHELYLQYQPVYDIVAGQLAGCEALVRWKHPQRGFVSPGDFIPVAERSGLIVPLGSWVLREACEQLAAWRAEHGEDRTIATINVNVAARQLREAGFVDEVAAVLSDTGLRPGNLCLEVTETAVIDGRQVRETLQSLHELGVNLALDDFGTGQSSLSLLRAFPVDVLKLDKSFVDGICEGEDRGRLAVAAAVAQLAEYLQLKAVAEGIESAEQRDRLREMGYRYGQGFHMARPLSAADFAVAMAGTHRTAVSSGQPT